MIEKIQIVHKDFRESFESMPLESVGRLTLALFRYANDNDPSEVLKGDVIAETFFPTLKAHIERHEDYRLSMVNNGKKGGAPVGNSNARKTTKNNQKQAPNPNPNPYHNPINNKKTYGECQNVLLTDDEYQKIKDGGMENLIDELSLYIAGKGDKYKSHYAVIRQWANRRTKPKENNFTQGARDKEYDFEAILKRKVVN